MKKKQMHRATRLTYLSCKSHVSATTGFLNEMSTASQ